jgi:hypothetical protein
VHPHWFELLHVQAAFSPHTLVPSPALQIFVQNFAVGLPSTAHRFASPLPPQPAKSVQYLPTPFELPTSPGSPQ